MRSLYIFPCLLITAAFSCKEARKPAEFRTVRPDEYSGPVVFYTSLADSLPDEALEAMHLGNVTGIKIKYMSGHENRYFEYIADKETVIRTISQLPFTRHGNLSDTQCRPIPYENLSPIRERISSVEHESASFFWNTNPNEVEVYECIKSPFRHILLINPKSNHILHRIEVLG